MTDADLVRRYLDAFNARDRDGMLDCVSDDVAHHVNQGGVRRGKTAFAGFLAHMDARYEETLKGIVILTGPPGRVAAEFTVHGTYRATDAGLPEATGQTYVLPAGAFYTVRDGRIARVAVHYDLADWTRQVGG